MAEQTQQISDILPVDADLFGGEISLSGDFTFNYTHTSRASDLLFTGFEMRSDFGNADCTMVGKQHYFAISELYRYKEGLCMKARLYQPLIQLHFQLLGSAKYIQTSQPALNLKLDVQPGETNLMIVPPLNESFELKEDMGGTIFSILLSMDYLKDLSNRFPYQIEPVLAKIKENDFCLFSKQNLPITPRMRGVIQRIQNSNASHVAGSLFLEAQILELFFLFFSQLAQPDATIGYSLSRQDRDRIHRAGEILTEQFENPPTLAELSKLIGTNEFKLKQGFKEIFGTTPYAYHLQYKMEHARMLVLDTGLTLAEIAYRVGYSDPAHFTNAFRKEFGIPPSGLR